jgi:hypothetical protein
MRAACRYLHEFIRFEECGAPRSPLEIPSGILNLFKLKNVEIFEISKLY